MNELRHKAPTFKACQHNNNLGHSMKQSILKLSKINKSFKTGDSHLHILKDLDMEIFAGEKLSIVGPSGSGKSTLLSLCAGLDLPDNGEIILNKHNLTTSSEKERARLRNQELGFIFQSFQLINSFTALENVMIPLELKGVSWKEARDKATALLSDSGLGERLTHYPAQLSGGEQQRVAIARAFANEPKILFADEPTGNLDEKTGEHIEELLFTLNKESGTTLVLVTHDLSLADKTDRVLHLKHGKIVEEA